MRPKSACLRLEELETRLLLKGPADAPPLGPPPPPSATVVWVDTEPELQAAIGNLQSGQTVVIQKGTYTLTRELNVGLNRQVSNVTIRGETEDFRDVVLRGQGMDNRAIGMGLSIYNAQDVTIANLSIGEVYYHAIQLQGSPGAERVRLYHNRLYDAGEQIIKSNPGGNGVDNCVVEYNLVEYSTAPSTVDHGPGPGYTDGISAHESDGWIIRDNLFRNFHTPDASAWWYNPVVLMWNHSSNTVVEGNTFINCDRAIALGLVDRADFDHQGGVVRNNMIYMQPGLYSAARIADSDGQILVYDSPGTKVYHNTILTNGNSRKSIEGRWNTSGAEFRNNLADAPLGTRDGAVYAQSGNYLSATAAMFLAPAAGNLHLVSNSQTQGSVIDKATPLAAVPRDWDGDTRPIGSAADIGADEFRTATPPPPPTPSAWRFDFGTSTSPVAAGYTQVTSATTYSTSQGYGWQSGTIADRDYTTLSDALTRDFNYTTQGTFAVDVANGTYTVTLTMGSPAWAKNQMGVFLEGARVDSVNTAAGQIVSRTYRATVSDGQLTLLLRDLGGDDPFVVINGLDIVVAPPAPSAGRFDFGTSTSPVAAGYTQVTSATTYSTTRGYGWQSGTIADRDYTTLSDALTRDFNYTTQGTFAVDVANGTYNVTLTMGSPAWAKNQMGVFLEGAQVDSVNTAAGQIVSRTYRVTGSDGQLTLLLRDLGGDDPLVVINSLDITPATP